MATFHYNRFSNENPLSQWKRYIQNQSYVTDLIDSSRQQTQDISRIMSRQTKDIGESIEGASKEQSFAIQQATDSICGTLESGFELLSDNLQDISYGIDGVKSELNAMASMLDWKLSILIEKQRITNLLLGNIAVLLRIPDIQKERQYHIEQGIKFLNNAFFDNGFYDDALNNLLKAEKIEPTDFFALHRIGLIYLYSSSHLDLNRAEEYFRKAAKYAVAETNAGAMVTTNYLRGNVYETLLSQTPTVNSIRLQAAEAYMFAGRCCYIQGKFSESADLSGKSFGMVPNMVEAGFTQAKALSADDKISEAAIVLEAVIETDRFYSIKVASDLDLGTKNEIKTLLENFRDVAITNVSKLLAQCKDKMIQESIARDEIAKIETLASRKSYLHSKKAIDLINTNSVRAFSEIFLPDVNTSSTNHLNELKVELSGIANKVKYPGFHTSKVNALFMFLSQNTQWNFPQILTIKDALDFGSGYRAKCLNSSMETFIIQEREYFEKLDYSKSHIMKVIAEIYSDDVAKGRADADSLRKRKNKEFVNNFVHYSLTIGFPGALIGVFLGFCKGCSRYVPDGTFIEKNSYGHINALEPFWYIPETALTLVMVGVVIGFIISIIRRIE
jgi:tetratricopeptide (TPR) repeat protein